MVACGVSIDTCSGDMMKKQLICSMGLLGTLSGCASFSTFGLARTLNQGAVQGWVAPGGGGGSATTTTPNPNGTSRTQTATLAYPLLEGGVRVGVTDNIELGGKLGFNGITLESKFGLIRSPSMDSGVNLSLAPAVGFIGYGGSSGGTSAFLGALSFHLPVLVGIDFGGHELVLGPRLVDQVVFGGGSSSSGSGSSTINVFYVGGSIGFAIRVSSGVRILPEFAVGIPTVATGDVGPNAKAFNALLFQGGVAFLFGSSNQYDPPTGRNSPLPAGSRTRSTNSVE